MDFPQTMFGVALLGYTGETSDGDWLAEADQAMLQKYPFISEIDAEHTVGNNDYLYCLVPIDENSTVSVNLTQWDPKTDTEDLCTRRGRCIRISVLHTGSDRRQRRQ